MSKLSCPVRHHRPDKVTGITKLFEKLNTLQCVYPVGEDAGGRDELLRWALLSDPPGLQHRTRSASQAAPKRGRW